MSEENLTLKNSISGQQVFGSIAHLSQFLNVRKDVFQQCIKDGRIEARNGSTWLVISNKTEKQTNKGDNMSTQQSAFAKLKKYPRVTIQEALEWFENGVIIPYSKNRSANGAVNKLVDHSRVSKIANDFKPGAVGTIRVGFHNGELTIADGHHRMFAIKKLKELQLIDQFSEREMSIEPIEEGEFLTVYTGTNNSRSHSLSDKLSNSDLPYSALLRRIMKDVDMPDKKSFLPNVSDALCGFALAIENNEVMSVSHLYRGRPQTEENANSMEPEEIGTILSLKNKALFYKGLRFYTEVLKSLDAYAGYGVEGSKKLKASPGLFMVIICDALGEQRLADNGPDMAAFSAITFWSDTAEAMTSVARRDVRGKDTTEFAGMIDTAYKYLLGGPNKTAFKKKYAAAAKEAQKRLKKS